MNEDLKLHLGIRFIHHQKARCVFSNDDPLPAYSEGQIVAAVSGCLLPTGSWSVLDSLFPDETPSWTPDSEFLAGRLHSDHFTVEYVWCGWVDDWGGWTGDSSLEGGFPYEILWYYAHGPETLYLEMTLV
ncbi:hypothetical protein EU546_00780 [Candidatus Thorarchaeota archaeon]|nr:MAG: hypothetical protein EU546_00780 [Candidatus Thorarchaeota archaeon]